MIELIQKRLDDYAPSDPLEEENALKEIVQEIALFALWREDFFEVAAFQGDTSLRILHGLPRFSEDIDFILKQPDPAFTWQPYLKNVSESFREFGIEPEVLDRKHMDKNVKAALIKDNSIANQLNLGFINHRNQKIKIKLEIDCNPPAGSNFDYSYLNFPVDFEVCHQDMSSNLALKIHALLCRSYIKGRDWYDFNWYVSQGVAPNLKLTQNALFQFGPYSGMELNVDRDWLINALDSKIESIDWQGAARDVERFIKPVEQKSLSLWSVRFFKSKLHDMKKLI